MEALNFIDGRVSATIDLRVYRIVAVQKAAYRFAARCTVIIGAPAETTVPLTLMFAPNTSEQAALQVARDFFNELLDQELRERVGVETRELRALILAHAFSRTGLAESE